MVKIESLTDRTDSTGILLGHATRALMYEQHLIGLYGYSWWALSARSLEIPSIYHHRRDPYYWQTEEFKPVLSLVDSWIENISDPELQRVFLVRFGFEDQILKSYGIALKTLGINSSNRSRARWEFRVLKAEKALSKEIRKDYSSLLRRVEFELLGVR